MNVKIYLRSLCCILMICFASKSSEAQSPGGISASNTIWLRSDNGITNTSGTVTQWQDNSGAAVTGPFTVQSIQAGSTPQTAPQFVPIGVNFNPYVRFNGLDNSLSSTNTFSGTSIVGNSNVTVFQVLNVRGGIVWLKWETDQVGSGARLGFENAGGNIRFDFPKAVPASAGQNVGVTNVLNKHSLSTVYADATASINRVNGADDNILPIPGPGDFSTASDKIVIGNESLLNLPAEVDMAELIMYSTTLTAADINKIESYLAIKYGFTLNQSAPWLNNYTASNGTITWNNAQNIGYGSDITGIGRNDATALLQKQSLSVNTSAIVTIYNGTYAAGPFPADNQSNSNGFTNDLSWLIMGDNAGTSTLSQCIFNGKGQRMQRVWKVSKTGTVGAVTISVDQAAVPANAKNILVSANPAFPPGATSMIPLTAANGKLFASVTFNHNEYYSFSSDTLIVNTVVTQPLCTNPNSGSVATTVSGGNTPLTYSWNPSGQNTANLQNAAGGNYTLTISQGTCQSQYPVTLNTPSAPTAPSANPVSVCPGSMAILQVLTPNATYTYNWYSTLTGGTAVATGDTYTIPVVNGPVTFYVEAVNGSCKSIRTPVPVTITAVLPLQVNSVRVCAGTAATLNVVSPVGSYVYGWFANSSSTVQLGTGISFTTTPVNADTAIYVEIVGTGCAGNRIRVSIDTIGVLSPAAAGTAACLGQPAMLQVTNPQTTTYTYQWFDVATGGTPLFTGSSFQTAPVSAATTYYLEAIQGSCASTRIPVAVSIQPGLPSPVITTGAITTGSIQFNWVPVTGALGYQVSVNGGNFIVVGTVTSYTVTGLMASETVQFEVIAEGNAQSCGLSAAGTATATTYGTGFYMPSAFTPNGDQVNPVIRPHLPGSSSLVYFTIYNRWGEQVFNTRTENEGWNGSWKGKLQVSGVYVWICRYLYRGRPLDEKGSFMLLH